MPNIELEFALFSLQGNEIVLEDDLQSHIAANEGHVYVEVQRVSGTPVFNLSPQLDNHKDNLDNPHRVNLLQLGGASEQDVALLNQAITSISQSISDHALDHNNPHQITAQTIGALVQADLDLHTNRSDNPHQVNASQAQAIGLNTLGQPNGTATLDSDGKLDLSQVPLLIKPKFAVVNTVAEMIALVDPQEGWQARVTATQANGGGDYTYDADTSTWILDLSGSSSPSISVYGSNFQRVISNSVKTTTSSSYSGCSKVKLQTSILPVGNYQLMVSYGWNFNDTSRDFIGWINCDGVLLQQEHRQEPKDSGGYFSTTGTDQKQYVQRIYALDNISGSIEFDLRFRSGKHGKQASMWDASITLIRVS